jgi:outer membrane protein OmpU
MNKLTKLGVSALCGSLAAVASANAGELTVSGGSTATYSSNTSDVTGNPIGMATALSFDGAGELDNGTGVAMNISLDDQAAWSAGAITLTTPSMGTITITHSGGGIDRYDDMMPTAWEETDGTSLSTGLVTVSGNKASGHVEWGAPSSMLPEGMSVNVLYSPRNSGGMVNDKSVGGAVSVGTEEGYGITVGTTGITDGLNVFAGYSETKMDHLSFNDKDSKVLGATYAVGPATLGYQISDSETGAISSGVSEYDNTAYGINFAVNDNLSISYGTHKSEKKYADSTAAVEMEIDSLQLSYTMGGATVSVAETEGENLKYNSALDKDATTVALSLAF